MKLGVLYVGFQICYFIIFTNADNHQALIFNRSRNSLIILPEKIPSDIKCDTWVTVCPAKTAGEQKFNENYSFYMTALFVRDILNKDSDCSNLHEKVCDEPYKFSMASFRETIEFGFEIYLNESLLSKHFFDVAPYNDFESVKYILKMEMKSASWKELAQLVRSESKNKELVELKMNSDEQMEFIWISLIRVWFKTTTRRFRKLEYQIRQNNINAMLSCENYDLGKEFYFGANVDSLYLEENQKKVFVGLKLPENESENACELEFKCLSKWLLVPADQFQFGSSSPIACSNVATVPIWKSTIEWILQKLDHYLYALARVTENSLHIVAGAHETLKLNRVRFTGNESFLTKIFRTEYISVKHEKFDIWAPNIIYKIVKLQTNLCEVDDDSHCWYGVLIVIHNDPYFNGKNKICQDRSEALGWSEIKYKILSDKKDTISASEFIYVCKINQQSIEKVGLVYNHQLIIDELSLLNFPYINEEKFPDGNVKDRLFEELKQLSEPEMENKRVIERPPVHDKDFDLISENDDNFPNNEHDSKEEGIKVD